MSDDGTILPKRRETAPTIPIPREHLKPVAVPAHDPDADTLEACPACAHCPTCRGAHVLTPTQIAEYRAAQKL